MNTSLSSCTPILIALITYTAVSCTKYQIPENQGPDLGPLDDAITTSTCDPDTIYFQNSILPLVVSSCGTTGCHDQESHKDGIILTDYASIIKTGEIKPGDPGGGIVIAGYTDLVALAKNGSLMGSVKWESAYARMPINQQLPDCSINLLQKWIDEGTPE
jgi:hypothetical protein